MAEKAFKLEIVTPKKLVFSGEVVSFSAPGVVGGFQILSHHAPLLAAIGTGEVKLRDAEGNERRYATSGGFVDVRMNHVVMLAETVERSEDIDAARAEAARHRAVQRLSEPATDLDVDRARASIDRAQNRLRIAQKT